jgi:hypothetical protein
MFSLIIYILVIAIGFMMGYVYRKSFTTAQFFQVEPKKLLRVFTIVFGVAVVATFALSWLTTYVLHDTTIPDDSSMKYKDAKSVMVFLLNVFFLSLMIIANLYSQAQKKVAVVPYLLVFGFYVLFVLNDAYFISDYFLMWQQSLKLLKGDLPDFHSTAWMKSGLAFFVTSFNAAMVWWGLRK